jgi:hypothetical protein
MVSLGALWLPILLAAVFVFVTSSILHMALKYHASDYLKLPNEDAVRAAIRSSNPPPGQYVTPHVADMKELEKPEVKQKFLEGPLGVLWLRKPGPPTMGPMLGQWFVFCLVVSFFTAYITCHALPAGTPYLKVFQIAGAAAFSGYALGQIPAAIWMGKPWKVAWKEVMDGLIYSLVTAGTFGWLWPR